MNQSLSQIISQPVMSYTQCMNQGVSETVTQLVGQPINQSLNQSICQSINQSITHSLTQSINHSIKQSINQSIKKSINQSLNQSIHQTNNQFDWVVTLSLQMKSRGVSIMKDKLCIPFLQDEIANCNCISVKMTENSKNCHFHFWNVLCTIFLNFLTVGKILCNGLHTITKIEALCVFIIPY